ncbi:MAG: hypothetical protein QOJ89_3817 [bacterium]|jgi:hypothetical protein
MALVNRSSGLSFRTLVRAVLPLFVLAALLPAVASAQDPGTGGYAGTAPTTVTGTTPESGTEATTTGAGAPAQQAPAQAVTAPTATLPFTGFQIALMIAAGLGLVGLGMALRRVSRPALPGI